MNLIWSEHIPDKYSGFMYLTNKTLEHLPLLMDERLILKYD